MSTSRIFVTIAIFKGEPLDLQMYRHTSLYFQFEDAQEPVTIHAVGVHGCFNVEVKGEYTPKQDAAFAKGVDVGWLNVTWTKPQLVYFVQRIHPDNTSREYNCHSWVEEVLRRFKDAGYISKAQYANSLDGMIEATMEATDEE